ncbi:MAG: hypothetical protein LBT38_01965 [Deltaproteobacteria bacterium]|nr:hypothetical protein [Deltaproteobacteria bacterium]
MTSPLGEYFITYEEVPQRRLNPRNRVAGVREVKAGLWRFVLTQKKPETYGLKKASPIMLAPVNNWRSHGQPPKTQVTVAKRANLEILKILKDDGQEVFSIAPYSPDGLLSGLAIFGDSYSHVLGLGADFGLMGGSLNLKGHVSQVGGPSGNRMVNKMEGRTAGLQAPIMFALGEGKNCAAIFVNETKPLVWDFSSNPWTVGLVGPIDPAGSLEFFVIVGEDLKALRQTYMSMVGRSPVPPRSLFRPWIVDQFRGAENLDGYYAGFKGQLERYKSGALILGLPSGYAPLELAMETGLDLMVVETPYVPVGEVFNDLANVNRGYLVKEINQDGAALIVKHNGLNSGLLDYTNPRAANYWHDNYRYKIFDRGVTAFFLQGGEPESYSALAWYQGNANERSHYAWANRFSLKWMESLWRSSCKKAGGVISRDEPRRFLMARSGLASLGRYGSGFYYMDPNPIFNLSEGLARAHLSLSGVDYVAPDIFPWLSRFSLRQHSYNFAAWLSRNALLSVPYLVPRVFLDQPWSTPSLNLRTRFEPYLYSLAHQAYLTGEPVNAPLAYHFQEDVLARDSAIETMVGPFVLVVAGIFGQENNLSFTLPAGRWLDYLRRTIIEQPTTGQIVLTARHNGLPAAPILLRSGAIVPTKPENPALGELVQIIAFPGKEETFFDWREDDGMTFNYWSRGQRRRDGASSPSPEAPGSTPEEASEPILETPEETSESLLLEPEEPESPPEAAEESGPPDKSRPLPPVHPFSDPLQDECQFPALTPEVITTRFLLRSEGNPDRPSYILTINRQTGVLAGSPTERAYIVEFVGVGNRGELTLDQQTLNRFTREEELLLPQVSGWMSLGDGRALVKTKPLDVNADHVIVLR